MKVLLKQDVDSLGYAGEVLTVADGYGRNYLIPRGLAVKASSSVLKEATAWRDRAAVRMAELRKEHEALAERISGTLLNFTARAGETGKLYGSVTTAEIVDQLNETLGTEIDRRQVPGQPLRMLGDHSVTVRLSRDFAPQLRVVIHPFEEEEPEDAEGVDELESEEVEPTSEAGPEGDESVDDEPVHDEPVEVELVDDVQVDDESVDDEPVDVEPVDDVQVEDVPVEDGQGDEPETE